MLKVLLAVSESLTSATGELIPEYSKCEKIFFYFTCSSARFLDLRLLTYMRSPSVLVPIILLAFIGPLLVYHLH